MTDPSTVSLTSIIDRPDRACIDVDSRVFHPRKQTDAAVEFAKRICRACPVITDCLVYATTHDLQGIWAATTHQERRADSDKRPLTEGALPQ